LRRGTRSITPTTADGPTVRLAWRWGTLISVGIARLRFSLPSGPRQPVHLVARVFKPGTSGATAKLIFLPIFLFHTMENAWFRRRISSVRERLTWREAWSDNGGQCELSELMTVSAGTGRFERHDFGVGQDRIKDWDRAFFAGRHLRFHRNLNSKYFQKAGLGQMAGFLPLLILK